MGDEHLGIYSAAVKLSEVFYFIPVLLSASLFPAILEAKNQGGASYERGMSVFYSLMFWFAASIFIFLLFFSEWLVLMLYGESYLAASDVLTVHAFAGIFVFLGVAYNKYLVIENLQNYIFLNTLVGVLASIGLNMLLIERLGIIGAAVSAVISYFLSVFLLASFSSKLRKNSIRMLLAIFCIRIT